MKTILLATTIFMTGCAAFLDSGLGERTVEAVQRGTDTFCATASEADREEFINRVNPTPNNNKIFLVCGDAPERSTLGK